MDDRIEVNIIWLLSNIWFSIWAASRVRRCLDFFLSILKSRWRLNSTSVPGHRVEAGTIKPHHDDNKWDQAFFTYENNAHAFAIYFFSPHIISVGIFSYCQCAVAYCVARLELWSEWMISFFLCSCMQHTHLNMCSTAESILSRREKISAYVRLWERAQPIAKPNSSTNRRK